MKDVKRRNPDPRGRIDIAAFRIVSEVLLPKLEERTGLAGLADHVRPFAEAAIADLFPARSIFPRPRRRLC